MLGTLPPLLLSSSLLHDVVASAIPSTAIENKLVKRFMLSVFYCLLYLRYFLVSGFQRSDFFCIYFSNALKISNKNHIKFFQIAVLYRVVSVNSRAFFMTFYNNLRSSLFHCQWIAALWNGFFCDRAKRLGMFSIKIYREVIFGLGKHVKTESRRI